MNVLLTGASGFVGGHVLNKLCNVGHNVLAIARQNLESYDAEVLYGDLKDLETLTTKIIQFRPDSVIHLGWEGIPDFSESISRTNLHNSIALLNFILTNTNCKKILVSGSCWEYGKKQGVCKEFDTVSINSYFSWAKHSLNQYLHLLCADKGVNLNWFRMFFVYGPGQREGSLIPTLINAIGAGEIPQINTPLNKNDFVYVEDVAEAFIKALNVSIQSGVYNLGSGYSTTVYDICRIVEQQLLGNDNISNQVLDNGQQIEAENFWASMDKSKQALNVSCDTGLEEGLMEHIKSMQLGAIT